jgi:hypothetical protein
MQRYILIILIGEYPPILLIEMAEVVSNLCCLTHFRCFYNSGLNLNSHQYI